MLERISCFVSTFSRTDVRSGLNTAERFNSEHRILVTANDSLGICVRSPSTTNFNSIADIFNSARSVRYAEMGFSRLWSVDCWVTHSAKEDEIFFTKEPLRCLNFFFGFKTPLLSMCSSNCRVKSGKVNIFFLSHPVFL